jgi:hypothetical protein
MTDGIAHAKYDIVIVGAGISGLVAARELTRKHPKASIALAERYKGLGGRTYSYWPPGFEGVHWEMGAGRVRSDHKLLLGLLKEYGLSWMPIGEGISFQEHPGDELVPNQFETAMIPMFLDPLQRLRANSLGTHTIETLLEKVVTKQVTHKILEQFPYRSEVNVLRADLALEGFTGDGEMSSHRGYGIVKEGFSELVARMKADLENVGVTILQRHRLLNCEKGPESSTICTFQFGRPEKQEPSGTIQILAEKAVVLALHRDAVAELPCFRSWKTLEHLKTQPLLRTYAIFPTKGGTSWFSDLNRVVTPERPRYILPMDPKRGVIMISYTEGEDTVDYKKILDKGGDKALEKAILNDVRKLFPDRKIPAPKFFRSHYWETGTTYWLPGDYDPVKESKAACHPLPSTLPNVWLCGESWCIRQAWVEGALEHTQQCLGQLNHHL